MNRLMKKIVSALAAALVAGAIAIGGMTLLEKFPGFDIVAVIVGVIAGAATCVLLFEKVLSKKKS